MTETEEPEKGFFRSLSIGDWMELALYVAGGIAAVAGVIGWLSGRF